MAHFLLGVSVPSDTRGLFYAIFTMVALFENRLSGGFLFIYQSFGGLP